MPSKKEWMRKEVTTAKIQQTTWKARSEERDSDGRQFVWQLLEVSRDFSLEDVPASFLP